jgi:AbrB family looped-hinge helix DNA binding protein
MISVAKMTSKGQVTIPKEIREFLSAQAGTLVVFEREDDRIVIRPHKTLRDYRGVLKGRGKSRSFDEIRRAAKEAAGKRVVEEK